MPVITMVARSWDSSANRVGASVNFSVNSVVKDLGSGLHKHDSTAAGAASPASATKSALLAWSPAAKTTCGADFFSAAASGPASRANRRRTRHRRPPW